MSKFNTFLAAIGMVFLAFTVNAQTSFTFVPSNTSPDLGETVTVDVVVTGFTEIASFQFSINWDENFLDYQGVSNFNLPFLSAGSFGTTQVANGILVNSWSDQSLTGYQTVPDGTVLYTITYDVIATGAVTTDIEFTGSPLGIEVIQDPLTEITGSTMFNNTTLLIDGGGGGSTGPGCGTFTGFGMTVTSDSAATGNQVCLDVAVCSFTDIISAQYTMQFDPNTLQFDNVSNFNLPNLDAGNFGTTNAGNGFITVSWFDSLGAGITVPDETVIYSICFTAIGAGGEIDTVAINGALSPIEVTDVAGGGANIGLESIDGEVTITGNSGSAVTMIASQETGSPGDTVTVDISVRNFDSIATIQGSMLWDPAIIDFLDVTASGNLPGPMTFNTNPILTDAGKLTFGWDDPATQGVDIADDVIIYSIRYIITGDVTDVSAVDFTDDPTVIEVTQANNGMLTSVPLAKIPGLVEVIGVGVLTININTVTGCTGDTVCIPFTPENFNEIVSIQYDINWDTLALEYIGVQNFGLSGLSAGQFNEISGTNRIRLSWVEPLLTPQTLVDGDTIYEMCFEILAADGASSIVNFDQNQDIEFAAGSNANSVPNFIVNDGGVNVDCSVGTLLEVSDTTITNVLCNGDATGEIEVTVANDVGTVTYAWSPNVGTTNNVTGLTAGTYTVTITDDNTTIIETYTITEPSALTLSSSSDDVVCNGDDDGEATVTPSGGVGPYTYSWTGGLTTQTITGLAPGTYDVTVTDANMCTETTSETIAEPTALSVTMSSMDVSVNGGSDGTATAAPSGGVGPYDYDWSPGGGTTATITGLSSGTYNVTITDANDCTIVDQVAVNEPGAVSATISGTDVTCNGDTDGEATVTASGGVGPYTYTWNPNVGNSATETGLAPGSYSVTVEDTNSATTIVSVTIGEPAVVTATVTDDNVTCNGDNDGTATVTPAGGNGGYSYVWTGGGTTATITSLTAGQYDVTVTDSEGCTGEGSTNVSEPTVLSVSGSVSHESAPGANDGQITATPAGGTPSYDYDWSPGGATSASISNLNPGNYTVTITDDNDCTTEETFTVNSFDAPVITVVDVDHVDCNGDNTGAIDISVAGGVTPYNYSWTGGASTQDLSNLTAGNWTVTVTDNIGTMAIETITVTEESAIAITFDGQTNIDCKGDNTGAINVSVSGGVPNYTYNWGGGITAQDPTNLAAGTYTLTVTDDNGCTEVGPTVNITEPTALSVTVVSSSNINCNGDATGSIDITASGGTPGYTYNWGGGIIAEDPSGLSAGTYTVTVTDGNGCTVVGSMVTLTEPAAIIASGSATPISCFGASDATVSVSVTGGVPGYNYAWSPSLPNAPSHSNVGPGNYTITITDAIGCTTVVGPIVVTQPPALSVSNTVINASAANNDGSIDLTVTGGTPGYTYTWSNTATTEDISGLASGCYAVTVQDANNCSVVDSIKLGGIIVLTGIETPVSCAGNCDGTIDITVQGGIAPYTYSWAGGGVVGNAEDQTGLCPGNYAVTVGDSNGGFASLTFTIETPTALTVSNTDIIDETGNGCNGSINVTITGGTLPYTYQWSNGETSEDVTDLCKGDYTVTVIDANGCILISNTLTVLPPPLAVSMSSMTMAACNGDATGEICFSVLGGCGPYTVTLNNEQQISVSGEDICYSNLEAGSYSIVIQDSGTPQMVLLHPFTITEPDPIIIDVTNISNNTDPSNTNCNGSIDITVTGGTLPYSYQWSNGTSAEDPTGLCTSPPAYSVTVTDANNCIQTFGGIEIELGLSIQLVSSDNVTCSGDCDGSVDIEVFGGQAPYTYIWSEGSTSQDIFGTLCAGTYNVTVSDAGGMTATLLGTTINEPSAPLSVSTASTSNPTADQANGLIELAISGGWGSYTINWSDGGTGNPRGGLVEGNYTATVIDANGCTEFVNINLVADRLILDFDIMQPTCNGNADGQIDVIVSGTGSGDYTISWSNGQSGDLAFSLSAGDITVTVSDNNIPGLTITETISLGQPDELGVELVITPSSGPADGAIQAIVSGGTSPYTYTYSSGDNTSIAGQLASGIYGLIIADANGCDTIIPQIEVPVQGECLEARKVISPNNDGKNDELIISCVEGLNSNLKIFNRWGQLVWEADNYDNSWSGTNFDGERLRESGYFWVLEYDEGGETKQLKGAFTLLR